MGNKISDEGPRIYNLFPLLAGSVPDWEQRLPEIAAMKFNWVFLNPFHAPGFSGSLYSIKDYYQLHPLFRGESRESPEQLLRGFVRQAEKQGLAVMMDLVINHTAKDSPLVSQHPEWYLHEEDGSVHSPFVVAPNDPQNVTVWGDLAEIDYRQRSAREELLAYWKKLLQHYIRLGFHGFRCDAAYKVPGEVWAELIETARQLNPEIRFFAETLGAPLHQVEQLHSAGFDYFFNSAKWWDFHAGWLLEQYEQFRHIAPSIAFPESHDTERLAAEGGGEERHSRTWYLFTAFFSTGVMLPIGYEYGFRRKLHVVETRPEDWEEPAFDLTSFIGAVNAMKVNAPVLNEEGPQRRFTPPSHPLVGLLRQSEHSAENVVGLINTDTERSHDFGLDHLREVMGVEVEAIQEITPFHPTNSLAGHQQIQVAPYSMRIFHALGQRS
ncbi:Alpha amylase, catalytic domain subfamily, putative [Nitrosococcus oceani AFC27]|nr:alpha-amylase family glycosyl hydrolase [Nitrosococcus oceani]EDZ67188.1 Alpha amylase, catalytic domain subfamily, putative [Nitrosococcus oceani AFC27]KFI20134.1 alpha-amylase [Nitrosococcus oceani C-27]GEM21435.1 alpha-amylase [Nitrosococcus oceani]